MIIIVEHIPKESSLKFSKKEVKMTCKIKKKNDNICNTAKPLNSFFNKNL